ncbi:Calcium-transporting ATPase [Handroanthus impetiginosus]|uniref:P-type Ca(2+) transporter n=1 Tax=Handroanthus impetiginosus TaxID=429701 RepID=A0A2G9G084_9LAMI|nr:Calcium-transporting ATPase [Handroanthus impetiginosus]
MGKGGENYGRSEDLGSNKEPKGDYYAAWSKDGRECEEKYEVNREYGLSAEEVEKRKQIYGLNELEKHEGPSIFRLILDQFNDTLVRILLVAAVVSFVLAWYDGEEGGEMEITAFVEPLVIFLILIVNAIVGVWQENNAEKALDALKEIQSEHATVIREGRKISNLPAKELVPGDIVELRVGDKVPADMRVLSLISSTLRVEQGSLTGESEAVSKTTKAVLLAWYDGEEGGEMEITAFVEPLVIFLILIVNAIVGVWQENNAEKALDALKEIQSEHATVIREGRKISNLPAKELVPGDIVELRVGDKVPADMRVLSLISSTLRVEQGSLTGESEAVSKTTKAVAEDVDIQGKKCMVFAGTTVVNGNCICLVTQTGMKTEIGKVHLQIHEAAQSDDDTPLKKKLNEFGETLTAIIGVICTLVWLINVKYFLSWEFVDGWPKNFKFSFEKCTYYFEIAVALAVAAIPEGLPAVITTCLALGTRKMAAKNALVRKLPSVETLGCTTVICSDKTGTLTTNQMAVVKLVAIGSKANVLRSFDVEGTSYDPFDGKIQNWPAGQLDSNLQMIAKVAAICNDADVEKAGHDKSGHYVATGMPTEAALKVLVEKMGLPNEISSGPSSGYDGVLIDPPRRSDDSLISPWILFRYLVIGSYVGIATVGIFIIWYTRSSFLGIDLSGDGHSLVTYSQLANWGQCYTWQNFSASSFTAGNLDIKFDHPCEYFQTGKIKAMTLSLSVLVAIEMFNSLNALSEDGSLLSMPPWVNPWLLLAMSVSFGLHFLILYVPVLAQIFGIVPLSLNEWLLVLAVSFPVILIDEVLKFVGRCTSGIRTSNARRSSKQKAE